MLRILIITLVLTSSASAQNIDRTDIVSNGLQVSFFTEIFDYIAKLKNDASTFKVRFSAKGCRANRALQKDVESMKLGQQIEAELRQTRHACMNSSQPMSRFRHVKPEVPWVTDTLTVKKQIEIIAVPMVRAKFPTALASTENKLLADSIMRKVFFEDILQELKRRLSVLEEVERLNSNVADSAVTEIKKQIRNLRKVRKSGLALNEGEGMIHPSLSLRERRFLSMFLSAFMWRARGGGLYLKNKKAPFATQRLRLRYVYFAYQTIAELNGWNSRTTAVGASMGRRILWGWNRGHDLGVVDGDRVSDYKKLLVRGVYQTEGLEDFLVRDGLDPAPMRFAGEHLAYCYVFAWDIMSVKRKTRGYRHRLKWGWEIHEKKPFAAITKGPITWAEVCWGAALGLGFSETLLPKSNPSKR